MPVFDLFALARSIFKIGLTGLGIAVVNGLLYSFGSSLIDLNGFLIPIELPDYLVFLGFKSFINSILTILFGGFNIYVSFLTGWITWVYSGKYLDKIR